MKKIVLTALLLVATYAFSQSYPFKISGKIIYNTDKVPIESATIHLEKVKDSTVVTYTISNEKGSFNLEGKSFHKKVKMVVSFVGMQPFQKNIDLSTKNKYDFGTIELKEDDQVLDEIVIKSRAPITIKKDTLEFNVKSFKTKKDANVEDLLKKLPGVEVDENGKITVNGKPVNKILVNGKPFFGNDPKITTKNLTKDIIEKIQVTDTKSKTEAITGEDGDKNNKTINLTIKEENNKGWFGRLSAGAGTDKLYEGAAMVNRFNNDTRVSMLLGANNTNSPGFSFGEIQEMFGRGSSISINSNGSFRIDGMSFGSGEGLTKSRNAGINFADKFGKKVDVSMDYFGSGTSTENNNKTERENFFTNRPKYYSNTNSNSTNETNNHNFSGEVEIKIDSTLFVSIEPSFSYNNSKGFQKSYRESLDETKKMTNRLNSDSKQESTSKRFENKLGIVKRFGQKKSNQFIRFNLTTKLDENNSDIHNNTVSEIFGNNPSTESRKQFTDTKTNVNNYEARLKYRNPIIKDHLFLDLQFSHEKETRKNHRSTFDFDENKNEYTIFNNLLSSDFVLDDITNTPAIGLKFKSKKLRAGVQGSYVFRKLINKDKLRPEFNLNRSFEAIGLSSNLSYRFSNKRSMYIYYSLRNSSPRIQQLQAFEDVSNPLNIVVGNPNLKPTSNHGLSINYNAYDWQKRSGTFAYLSFSTIQNNVSRKTTIDDNLVKKTTYENVNGNYNINGSTTFSKSIKLDSLSTLTLNPSFYGSIRKNTFFVNGNKETSKTYNFNPGFRATYNHNKNLEISTKYGLSFYKSSYNKLNNQQFASHRLLFNVKKDFFKKLELNSRITYNYNPRIPDGFEKSNWFWNASLAYSVLKDQGTIRLKAYDILNQNNSVKRIATQNYIENSENLVLNRYFMLSFSWKFNSLGGKRRNRGNNVIIM